MKFFTSLKFSKRERVLIILGSVGLLFLLNRYWTANFIQQSSLTSKNLEKQLDTLKKSEITLSSIKKSIQKAKNSIGEQKIYSSVSQLLHEISKNINPNQTLIKNIKNYKTQKETDFIKDYFQVDIESSFLTLGSFLEKLEASNILINIESIEVNHIDGDMQNCNASIKIVSYSSPKDPS